MLLWYYPFRPAVAGILCSPVSDELAMRLQAMFNSLSKATRRLVPAWTRAIALSWGSHQP